MTRETLDVVRVPASERLDPITAIFEDGELRDLGHGSPSLSGSLTVICYGRAWTYWWGAMPHKTTREFVVRSSDGYVAECLLHGLGNTITNSNTASRERQHIDRIVAALVAELKKGGQ